ncbi:MAG: CPBP family intramembrane metalloprotease [Planctomycetes bacterium]|nr:CPBP family intramembrane metalloprotease [Planctomycetota bacterium]
MSGTAGRRRGAARTRFHYAEASNRPLEILAFLAPLVAFYELGLVFWLRSDQLVLTNRAHGGIVNFFRLFGVRAEDLHVSAMSLPSLALVLTLLIWQAVARLPWSIRWRAIPFMWLESFALAAPLLVLAIAIGRAHLAMGGGAVSEDSIRSLDFVGRASMAAGAGIYEELLFRMALMGGLHMLLFDVARLKDRHAWVVALLASTILFTVYHPIRDATGAMQWGRVIFLMSAGAWFGVVFQLRGFGVAAGTHAAYDATALLFVG